MRQASSPGQTVNYRVKIKSIGRIRAEQVKLCVSSNAIQVDKQKRPIRRLDYGIPLCQKLGKLRLGETKVRVFHLKVRNNVKPGRRIPLVFEATSNAPVGQPANKQVKTTLRIRHR